MCQRVFIQNDGKCAKLHFFFAFYGDFKKCSLKLRLFLIIKFFWCASKRDVLQNGAG